MLVSLPQEGEGMVLDGPPDMARLDPKRLRVCLTSLLYARGVPPATIARALNTSPATVYRMLGLLTPAEVDRLHALAS